MADDGNSGRFDLPQPDPHLLARVARSTPQQSSTAPGPAVTEVVAGLRMVVRLIEEHNRRVMAGERHDWQALADALAEANMACRGRVVIDLPDVGADGAR